MIKITGTQNNNLKIKVVVDGELFEGKLDLDHRVVSFELDDYENDFLLYVAGEIAQAINEHYGYFDEDSAEWYEFRFFYYDEDFDEMNEYGCSGFSSNGW